MVLASLAAAAAAAAVLIDAMLGALTTLGSASIRYAACLVYEHLYNAYETFRLAVAMNGLAFPLRQHLTDPRITHFANPALPDANGASVSSIFGRRPALKWDVAGLLHNERHLVYPPTGAERPTIFSVPASYLDKDSTFYAWGDIPQAVGVNVMKRSLVTGQVTGGIGLFVTGASSSVPRSRPRLPSPPSASTCASPAG